MVETKQGDVCLDALSLGDESDDFSELEMPRSSTRKRMMTAIAGGTLPQLVLERSVDLGLAVSKCFEVLGIATNSEDQQLSAARSLVSLCTHPDLRPAVDHLLVLRRLGRVVECTRAPAALGAALEALVAVADDAGWEDKAGVVAQLLRDGLCRCVAVVAAAAAAAAPCDDPALPTKVALAEAALAALDSARLRGLLTDQQLVEAGRAVSTFLATAAKHGPVSTAAVAALQLLLSPECWAGRQSASNHCSWPVPEVLGQAVVSSGAVEPLLGLLTGGSGTDNSTADGPEDANGVGLMALHCLRNSLLTCLRSSESEVPSAVHEALGVARPQHVVEALLPYLQHGDEAAAGLALDMLLFAVSCWGFIGVSAVVDALAAADGQKWRARAGLQLGGTGQELCAALLRAADSVLQAPSPGLTHKLASALLEMMSGLCMGGLIAPDELLAQCPGVRDVMVGVLTGQAPGSSWAAVSMPPGAFAVSYAGGLDVAALNLLDQLCWRTSLHAGNGFGPEVACSLAGALVHALLGNQIAIGGSVMRWIKQLRCLARCLQAVPEESGLWVADSVPVTMAPSRTQVSVRHMVQLVQQVSGILSNKLYEAFAEELREDALAAYGSVLRAAAVLAKAAWAAALDINSYRQNHHNTGNTGTQAEGQQAIGALLAKVLSIASSNKANLGLECTTDVLNAAVACLQPGLVTTGEGLAALPSVKALEQQQSGDSTLVPVSPACVHDLRIQLNILQQGNNNAYGYRAASTTGKDVLAGIQAAHRRLLELVADQVAAALSSKDRVAAAASSKAGGEAAGGGLAAVPAALRVATNAGQLLGHGLQMGDPRHDALSVGDDSEDFSMLDAPRPSTQARMRAAVNDGTLPQLVLDGTFDLGSAVSKCFELLGIATNSASEQRSAARSLVSLCTHPDLRPAVDHLLVLRRLGRVVECTRAPAALGAALEALVAVADDAGWEDKGGANVVAELLRDGLNRCIWVVVTAAAPSPNDSVLARSALAEAALAFMGSARLRALLTDQQLVAAVGAVSAYMTTAAQQGLDSLKSPLDAMDMALSDATWAGRSGSGCVPYEAGLALVGSGGVQPLLQLMEAGGSPPGSGVDVGSSAIALRCLSTALVACTRGNPAQGREALREALTDSVMQRAVSLAVQVLGRPAQASLALDVLLAAVACGGDAAAQVVATAMGQGLSEQRAALFRVVPEQLASGRFTATLAEALLHLASGLCAAEVLPADQLLLRCRGVTDAVAGVLLRQAPSSTWRALSPLAVEDINEGCVYTDGLVLAALRLLCQLLQRPLFNSYGVQTLSSLAAAQVDDLLATGSGGLRQNTAVKWVAHLQALVLCVQALPESVGLWRVSGPCASAQQASTEKGKRTVAAEREQVTISRLVQLLTQLSNTLAERPFASFQEALQQNATAAYNSVLRAAAVLVKAAWAALCDPQSYATTGYSSYDYGGCAGSGGTTMAEGQQAGCRLLVRALTIASGSNGHVSLTSVADVLNAAVACLQPDLAKRGPGLTSLCSVKVLKGPQPGGGGINALAVVTPAYKHDMRRQLTSLNSVSSYGYHYGYGYDSDDGYNGDAHSSQPQPGHISAKDLVGGIQGAQQRLLQLVEAAVAGGSGAGSSEAAGSSQALVQSALRVVGSAGQLLALGLQAYCA